jgi:hypothetical protein
MSRKLVFVDPGRNQQALLREMKRNGSAQACPRCGGVKFGVLNGFFGHLMIKNPDLKILGPDNRTAVALVCEKCGFLLQHGLHDLRRFVDEPQRN